MTYTIGDRRISLDSNDLPPETLKLILSHPKLFKYCLNNASYRFLMDLKKIIHLYGDVLTIYSTLLYKVPKYDDVTNFTSSTKTRVLKLEDLFNNLLGEYQQNSVKPRENWDDKSYDKDTRKVCKLCVELSRDVFKQVISCLNMIEVFFLKFDNLKKLLIPFLLLQAEDIHRLLDKLCDWFSVATIADDLEKIKSGVDAESFDDSIIMQQLKKIERITTGIERELVVLNAAFKTYNHSLQLYTLILLGKAILKRDIDEQQCQIIRRREVCFQAAEHVVNIPLHQDQMTSIPSAQLARYFTIAAVVLVSLISIVIYRLFKVLAW